jgi:hypothetical protein
MEEALQNQGVKPAQARQTAQRAADKLNEAKNSSSTAKSTRSLSSPLNKLSNSICRNPSAATQPAGAPSARSQNPGQNPGEAASPTPSECAGEAGDELARMSQSRREAESLRASQSRVQQAMRSMSGSPAGPTANQPGDKRLAGGGRGGSEAGVGSGGVLGEEQKLAGYQTQASSDMNPREGRVIASWMSDGQIAKGEAKVGFDQAVTEARQEAEKAVTDDRVPQRYHGAIKDYFDQMPE